MCPSSERPQCVFQVEVPAARGRQRPLHLLCYPLYLLHDLARWAPASSSLPSVTAPTRATRRAPSLAASPPPALPSSGPAPTRHAPVFVSSRAYLPFARAHAVHVPGLPRRHPAALPNAGQPSQDLLAWLKKQEASGSREQWTVSLPVAPPLRRPPACCVVRISDVSAHASPPADRRQALAFAKRCGGGCILGAGHCLRPVWLWQRLK